jgi:DNA polymerase-1
VSKDDRKKAKAVNFGFVYGMGWRKFIETAFTKYEMTFTEAEAKQVREAFFQHFDMLLAWHGKQRRLVNKYGRVESPLGRIRHLPDIFSPDEGVRAEAERQAINSPVQSFGSDLAVMSMVEINKKFKRLGIAGHCVGLVHDAVNYEIRNDDVPRALPIIQSTMEDMSKVEKRFGIHVDLPILADVKLGQFWGDAIEIEHELVQDFDWAEFRKLEAKKAA